MKRPERHRERFERLSRPSRARGLKRRLLVGGQAEKVVAPLAGAWIETFLVNKSQNIVYVAPLAGAWIETVGIIGIIK